MSDTSCFVDDENLNFGALDAGITRGVHLIIPVGHPCGASVAL